MLYSLVECLFSLTKLDDLLRSKVTNQNVFDQQDSESIAKFRTTDGPLLSSAGFQIGNLDSIIST